MTEREGHSGVQRTFNGGLKRQGTATHVDVDWGGNERRKRSHQSGTDWQTGGRARFSSMLLGATCLLTQMT